jgi:quinohemoprotein ethanol dehydrogenase
MAFNPGTGLVYVPTLDVPMVFVMPGKPFKYERERQNWGVNVVVTLGTGALAYEDAARDLPPMETLSAGQPDPHAHAALKAWDPVNQRIVWEVDTTVDHAGSVGMNDMSGVMTTASGLVFQGSSRGTLSVYDAESGTALRSVEIGNSMVAAPMTYALGGEQYIAIMAGGVHARILALKIGGGTVPVRAQTDNSSMQSAAPSVAPFGSPAVIARGRELYERTCAICHGNRSRAPNLTQMTAQTHAEFSAIVLEGLRADRGMGSFKDILSKEDARAIHAYVTDLAWQHYTPPNKESPHASAQ